MSPLLIEGLKVPSAGNMREHFRVRAKRVKSQRTQGRFMGEFFVTQVALPIRVTLTRIASRPLDDDNLQTAFKAFRDGIADAYGVDDKNRKVIAFEYAQRKGAPKQCAVEVTIETQA